MVYRIVLLSFNRYVDYKNWSANSSNLALTSESIVDEISL